MQREVMQHDERFGVVSGRFVIATGRPDPPCGRVLFTPLRVAAPKGIFLVRDPFAVALVEGSFSLHVLVGTYRARLLGRAEIDFGEFEVTALHTPAAPLALHDLS